MQIVCQDEFGCKFCARDVVGGRGCTLDIPMVREWYRLW